MRSFVFFSLLFLILVQSTSAQKFFSKNAQLSFAAGTPLEKIDAVNKSGTVVLDITTGKIESAVLVNGFQFDRALMQEHFNENYMESAKFPKATFKGTMDPKSASQLTKDGKYAIKVSGDMTMHGTTKPVTTTVNFVVQQGKIKATTSFNVVLDDFNIDIPSLVKDKVAKETKVQVDTELQPLK